MLKDDPSLFAYYFLKDRQGKPFTVFPYQDLVLNDPSKLILLCIARQTGKSTIAAIKSLHAAFFNHNFTVVIVSRTQPQSIELVGRIKEMMKSSELNWKAIFPNGKESKQEILIKNKGNKTFSRIISVPATDAARGYTADLSINDECAFWENGDYIFNQVCEPMTQFTKGTTMLLSTPNGKRGFFWNCYNSPYYSCYQFDWRVCPINTEAEMLIKASTKTVSEFQSEYEARFTSAQNAYFNPNDIRKCIDNDLVMGHIVGEDNLVVGVDFGKINDNAVIYIGKIENPMALPQDQIIKVMDRIVKPLGTNYAQILGELKNLNMLCYPRFFLDATGVGEAPADMLSETGAIVEPIKFSIQRKMDLFSNLKVILEQGRIRLPNELELRNQLELFEYEYTSSGNVKLHAPEGMHDDEVCGLALMTYGLSRANFAPVSVSLIKEQFGKVEQDETICKHNHLKYDEQGEIICTDCNEYV